ncbi:MAG: PDZ domain-containing protein, partial [Planctomycetota bacterium]
MRTLLLLTLPALLAPFAQAGDAEINEDVVKAVRALYSSRKPGEIKELKKALFARKDLDWPSVKKGLQTGIYYQKPLVTAYGERHSGKHMGIRLPGKDGRPRGFSLWVPEKYDAKEKIPVLFYLHHNSGHQHAGPELAGLAVLKFRKACEAHNVLFVAPYTMKGAEWWTAEGKRVVEWTVRKVKERYNIDEDRVGLMGALDGGDAVWYLAQEMPDTWSCLMPMTGDPYETSAIFRPIYLGTLDRMDVLMGVTGVYKGMLGDTRLEQYLAGLKPLFGQGMRITTAIYPRAAGDFRYLPNVREQVMAFVLDKKRKPLADEVDIATDRKDGLRSLWLRNDGYYAEGETPHNFGSTRLNWTAPERKDPKPKLGVHLGERKKWEVGIVINRAEGAAQAERIQPGDVLLEIDDVKVKTSADVKKQVGTHTFKDEVRVLLAREVKQEDLSRVQKLQAGYMKMVERRRKLRAEGKPVPLDLADQISEEEDEAEEEEEDDGESVIEMPEDSDGEEGEEGAGGALADEETVWFVFERFLYLRRPEGKLVRADFGASRDPAHKKEGVKLRHIVAGGQAQRSGFKDGDVIVAVGADAVEKVRDLQRFFEEFKFEKAPEGERFVEITIQRPTADGAHQEKTITVRWEPPTSSRLDARWDKKEKSLNVLARKCKGFTVYFTDELIKPGEKFHLFVNNVPWKDL